MGDRGGTRDETDVLSWACKTRRSLLKKNNKIYFVCITIKQGVRQQTKRLVQFFTVV